ncbi:uncharacterized protein [Blastocystis hominis]|uniref:Prohibitin n=1 Tax=Blastocystis hominis TaxID=12968 RepID=D8LXK9_BLAHO|nr:uncharacterized protein [Blastocystis hominis]CBK20314.2 unnamed protein product [Blastocystis hominis]|eukprot:XP_012894362.1 uncharacterized protein [Blastocystis hominis]
MAQAVNALGKVLKYGVATGLVCWIGYESLYNIDSGHRGVIYNRIGGIQNKIIPEGTHFLIPWFQRVYKYDIRTQPRTMTSLTGTRDLQMVNISLRVLCHPSIEVLPNTYKELGLNWNERVMPSIVNEVLKQVIAQFNASALLTQREQVSRLIQRNLIERGREFGIIIDDVAIIDLAFGREFTNAVEAKQVAQQEAERAKYVVEQAKQDKKSTIIHAEGEARSAKLIGEAMKNYPGFIELRRIDAAKEIAATIARSNNRVYLSAESLLLNVMSDTGAYE